MRWRLKRPAIPSGSVQLAGVPRRRRGGRERSVAPNWELAANAPSTRANISPSRSIQALSLPCAAAHYPKARSWSELAGARPCSWRGRREHRLSSRRAWNRCTRTARGSRRPEPAGQRNLRFRDDPPRRALCERSGRRQSACSQGSVSRITASLARVKNRVPSLESCRDTLDILRGKNPSDSRRAPCARISRQDTACKYSIAWNGS